MSSMTYRKSKGLTQSEIGVRTPLRVSFFGGGTDYPAWLQRHAGRVVGATINKYCEVWVKKLPKEASPALRLYYSTIELCHKVSEVRHEALRSCLEEVWGKTPLEVRYAMDLTSGSGMGSSSALSVSLLNALLQLQGKAVDKKALAKLAFTIDQERENVGCQDQILTCYGGINQITFSKKGNFEVTPLGLSASRARDFKSHLMLFYTGSSRLASLNAEKWIQAMKSKEKLFINLYDIAGKAAEILSSSVDISSLGNLFHESWLLKQKIHKSISNETIDLIYQKALTAGAMGGKLLGAGGGGFFLLFVPPVKQAAVSEALNFFQKVEFDWDNTGTTTITQPYTSQILRDPAPSLQTPLR